MSNTPSFHSSDATLLGADPRFFLANADPSLTTVVPLATIGASFTSSTISLQRRQRRYQMIAGSTWKRERA